MACAVIMAGGRGERFWPRSTTKMPKQFLSLIGERTMIQQTVDRLAGLIEIKDVYVVAGEDFVAIIKEQLPDLPPENIVVEPFGRDTAAAIGLAAVAVRRKSPQEVMVVLPADHYINNQPRFREVLRGAIDAAGMGEDAVTLGITPHRPETGYGYIRRGDVRGAYEGVTAYQVRQFAEKPDLNKAIQFLKAGDYLWNSGMFIWRVDLISKLIEVHTPILAAGLQRIEAAMDTEDYAAVLNEVFTDLPRISVDYGIMEKEERVLVIPGDFGWDDLGSWNALDRYAQRDDQGNSLGGNGVMLDTKNTYVYAPGKTVATIGVEDLILVYDNDCLLICHKDRTQEIKDAVQALSGR